MLVFYPLDFSPVCTDQLNVYKEVLDELEARGREALRRLGRLGLLPQGVPGARWASRIPLLADFHPKGEVAKAYGVYDEEWGSSPRALVMIGPDAEGQVVVPLAHARSRSRART